jgi:hypothetical protein
MDKKVVLRIMCSHGVLWVSLMWLMHEGPVNPDLVYKTGTKG